ncbi:uncharacterized protein DNG_08949 [Cephalotrichum gorgonifer]|uniref:DUF1993 domain-containing protein n=1 Tax=Cephalotrichum gorgonifer TaxID=2041049 RepID=A0AAE8N4U2_9PEZI|nr:uncharacterized protein DNG_08949 [Cephalotrichum gorgonifer]
MPYTFYNSTVPVFQSALQSLAQILKKAHSHAAENNIPADDLLSWRLADDMLPLAFQIHEVGDTSMKLVSRVQGTDPLPWSWEDIKTWEDARARISEAESLLAGVDEGLFEKRADETVPFVTGKGTRETVARGWVAIYGLPTLFFHLTTAYGILRNKGVGLGKPDYHLAFTSPWVADRPTSG